MDKHKDCEHECQQAVDYGVWPERSCAPVCVWLKRQGSLVAEGDCDRRAQPEGQEPGRPKAEAHRAEQHRPPKERHKPVKHPKEPQWKLVPVEPTPEMIRAFHEAAGRWVAEMGDDADVYRAMLAASPQPAQEPAGATYPTVKEDLTHGSSAAALELVPATEPAQEPVAMPALWSVSVDADGESILTIGHNWISGSRQIEQADERTILGAAQHLLAFIGHGLPPSSFDPDEPAAPSPSAPVDEAVVAIPKALALRCIAGIDHLAEIARQWEPDHSSGADRRGWVLAKDARDDLYAAITQSTPAEPGEGQRNG